MKLLSTIKGSVRKSVVAAAAVITAGIAAFSLSASALSLPTSCNDAANEVIWCGAGSVSALQHDYHSGDGHNSAAAIQAVFNYSRFGITTTDIDAMSSTAVAGSVTKTGDVIVNGKTVATNALTAGRSDMSNSTRVVNNGVTFYLRSPSVSFQESSLAAYVVMQNGTFQFAILSSCGNPITAKPVVTPKPNYTINKTVAQKGSTSFVKSLNNLQPGTHVVYHITVASTGDAAVQNLKVNDVLPAHVQYVSGTLKRDGTAVDASQFFGSGVTLSSLAAGKTTVFSFEAIVGLDETASTCKQETLNNVGKMVATNLPPASSSAAVSTVCVNVPVCTNLTLKAEDNRTVEITRFTYQANGATFKNAQINWGDTATTNVTDSTKIVGQQHRYSADNTYKVAVTLTFTQNGKSVTANGAQCQSQVTFKAHVPPSITPVSTPPTTPLPNTGPGSVIGLFGAVTVAGALVHRYFLARRLNKTV